MVGRKSPRSDGNLLPFPVTKSSDSDKNKRKLIMQRNRPMHNQGGGRANGGSHRFRNDVFDERANATYPEASKLLPSDEVLSPRADVWIYLCASSFVGVASLANAHARYQADDAIMQTPQKSMGASTITIITLLSLNAAISLIVGVAYRHHPSLMALTNPMSRAVSLEFLLAGIILLFWVLCTVFYSNFNDPAFHAIMDMPLSQTNANFFYSLWITGILSLYLVADLASGNNREGVISIASNDSMENQTVGRLWMLLLFSSILLLSFSASLRASPACGGTLMQESPYCASTTTALTVSILGMIVGLSYRANSVRESRSSSRMNSKPIERVLALVVLIVYACNAGITTSPGGSGANMGNVYVTSWLGLILAFILNVSYLKLHFTSSSHEIATMANKSMSKREELDTLRKNSQNGEGSEEEYFSEDEFDDMDSHVFR